MSERPVQPVILEEHGVLRFEENKIVVFLLDHGGYDMNKIAAMKFSVEDREQFAQLIGYSLGGFDELSYVRGETSARAWAAAEAIQWAERRRNVLERLFEATREAAEELVDEGMSTNNRRRLAMLLRELLAKVREMGE